MIYVRFDKTELHLPSGSMHCCKDSGLNGDVVQYSKLSSDNALELEVLGIAKSRRMLLTGSPIPLSTWEQSLASQVWACIPTCLLSLSLFVTASFLNLLVFVQLPFLEVLIHLHIANVLMRGNYKAGS
jgi:hypothetical protein